MAEGVFIENGGLSTLVDNSGPFRGFTSVAINNNDFVVFNARLDDGTFGLFNGPDALINQVISTGDSLFGSTVIEFSGSAPLNISNQAINDSGQIAFQAVLADGSMGIYRADPIAVSVPEPATLAIFVLGLAGMGAMRRRLN